MQKRATTKSEIPLPANMQPQVSTTLAWDNIDRLDDTLSGEGTSHRVNGTAVQARHFAPIPSLSSHLGSLEVSKGLLSHLMLLLYPFTKQVSVKALSQEHMLK